MIPLLRRLKLETTTKSTLFNMHINTWEDSHIRVTTFAKGEYMASTPTTLFYIKKINWPLQSIQSLRRLSTQF